MANPVATSSFAGGPPDQLAKLRREMAAKKNMLGNFVPGTGGLGPNVASIAGMTQAPVGDVMLPNGDVSAVQPFHATMDPSGGEDRIDAHAYPAGTFTKTAPGIGNAPLSPGIGNVPLSPNFSQMGGLDATGFFGNSEPARQRRAKARAGDMSSYLQNLMMSSMAGGLGGGFRPMVPPASLFTK